LGLENWKRATKWRTAIIDIGRSSLRVHDLRHTYASLARRAGADLRLLQKTIGHASITVTAHLYADLYDDELDDIASALDALDDVRGRQVWPDRPRGGDVGGANPAARLGLCSFLGGPGWYRTSDLPRVRRTLSH
jgi:hypothetical protein